ncbi:MAG TPA: AarF/UbiB family protein [Acidimicrobiales bacterium]|nr:AarF/UbiB family protein [Acidimicrobiales bacterium]
MDDVTDALVRHHDRLGQVARVLSHYGFSAWVAKGSKLVELGPIQRLTERTLTPADLDASAGERLRGALTELGTTWIKLGQTLSLRPDVVGADVARELGQLRADVPADAEGVAVQRVEAELGAPVGELFRSFEPQPFASGSVAQVHRAELEDGRRVAVKVLHQGVETTVLKDLELMQALAAYLEREDPELAQLRPTVLVDEFATMMRSAISLREELSNLQRFRENFADESDVVIPEPFPDLSTPHVLTMELISGATMTDRASVEATGWDVDQLVRRAANVYLEMIFRDGLYHADPHPGNFLLPDGQHLALLDFGDVGRITSQRRLQLETMIIAVAAHDSDALIDVILDLTTPPPGVDVAALRAGIETWLNRYFLIGVGQLDMEGIISSGMELLHRYQLVLPADMALLFRVLIDLQGLGRGVGTEVRVTELLEPYLHRIILDRYNPVRVAHAVARSLRRWEHLIGGLPGVAEAVLEQVRSGTLAIDLRIHDADHAVDSLVDGLVASASLLAGAELISRRTGPSVAGLSVPGMAAAGAGVLSWQRLILRRRPRKSWVTRVREIADLRRTSP